jgi:CheY-like chemotaxis protein
LLEARDKAEDATKAKSEFLALMSHEIRTPLNGLLGISELLNSTKLDAQQKEFVDIIRLSGEALLQVINDVLDFSKIEANRMQLEHVPFRLREVVEESLTILSGRAKEKGLTLEAELSSVLPDVVVGDKARLRQVLLNLLGNAIKFTERGSVKVILVLREKSPDGFLLGFEVRDTGVGIDLEQAKGLFSAFTQADASTFRKYGGSGLGLTICKNIVELMGGKIWVESQPGEGSSFFFTIRTGRSGDEKAHDHQRSSPVVNDGRPLAEQAPLRILLVEDNDINRLLAVKLLERLGYKVVSAADGREAFEMVKQQSFDLVFMDVQMPEWDGLESTRHIRAELPREHQPTIVAMTAFAGQEDRRACTDAGMDDYISKPITTGDLERVLLKWGGGAASRTGKSYSVQRQERSMLPDLNAVLLVENAAIQRLMEIARQSDPGFVQQVMDLFMKQAPVSIREIVTGASSGDLDLVWKAAHKLKGTSLQMGAARLGSICKALEESGRSGDSGQVSLLSEGLEKVYFDTVFELKSLFQYN